MFNCIYVYTIALRTPELHSLNIYIHIGENIYIYNFNALAQSLSSYPFYFTTFATRFQKSSWNL